MTDQRPIDVYTFGSAWGMPIPTASPFGVKVLAWLRIFDVPYRMHVENNPGKGPKSKCPWADVDGELVADSEHIVATVARERGIDRYAGLSARQRAVANATRLMLEEHYHQVWEHELFIYEGGWKRSYEFFDQLPPVARVVVRNVARSQLRKQLNARGVGRHSHQQIIDMGITVLDAMDELIGDGPFFFGEDPSDVDASVFGFMSLTKWTPSDSPVWDHFGKLPRLGDYCDRMLDRYFDQ